MTSTFPYFTEGEVVKGFGRGSKELGIPTGEGVYIFQFPIEVVKDLPEACSEGVYYGWAQVDEGPVFKMVMSIGWNPFYKNTVKSMETHIIHEFKEDFYGSNMKVCMLGFIRPMRNFKGLDELIAAIKKDISDAEDALETPEHIKVRSDNFFAISQQTTTGASCSI